MLQTLVSLIEFQALANQANPGGCDECQTDRTCSTTCDYTPVGRKWKARQKFFFEGGDSITSRLSASYNGLNNEEATDYRKELHFCTTLTRNS